MARITLFWCFWTKIFLNGMMEFQVKFCHLSGLRLWRTGMLFSTKSKDHKSNFRISWMCRYHFYDLKVQFWWPNKCSKHQVLRLNTLYYVSTRVLVHTIICLGKQNWWCIMIHVNSKNIRSLKGIFTPHRFTKFLLAFSAVPMYC